MKTIMIVDDANTVRTYHRMIVASEQRHVEEAENGVEALEKAMGKQIDLFMVDVNMPKMDGYRLCQEIRRDAGLNQVPIIMISTESQAADATRAFDCGANFYMTKPVDGTTLNDMVSLMLGE
ncbi:MAG: two-component system response regulator [Alteromonadaceae bacterium]|uniref:response regulator n=1 Tax=unclassified Alteromonas TaxID=2614992 RepID=UPI000C43AD28|nr:response regulator [Alteromonas sp. 1_MG-2023]MBT80716.1 two-component system response regulator [Alteromonadaceae bacterium]MDO6474776.1 response regulator [Alteromonas sp. 1_MG-2023]